MRVRVVRVILPARADRRAVGGPDYTRCIGSHYLSPGPVSVRMCPAVHGVLDAGVVPAPQPGWSQGLCQGLSFNDRLMDVPSGNLGCIEKCKSDMGCGLVCKVCLTSVS